MKTKQQVKDVRRTLLIVALLPVYAVVLALAVAAYLLMFVAYAIGALGAALVS
jgi:hypothetical protein